MTRRLLVTYLTITAFALALLAVPLGVTFAHREKERLLFGIERDADSIAAVVEGSAHRAQPFRNTDIERYAARTGGHVIVVDTHGIALLDTQRPTDPGRDYSTRPEIRAALTGRRVDGSRNSNTLRTNLLYAAVPTTAGGRVSGAVRVTYPASTLNERVWRTWERIGLLCTGVLAAVALLGFVLARSVTRPVHRLEQATDRLAAADLNVRVDELAGPPELRHLASTFNRMAERLAALLDAQERFVADASHQLRTPLTALRLRLENLEAHVDEPDRAAVQSAAAEVTRMSRLVDGLLALARNAAEPTTVVEVDVAEIARERADIWRDVLSERPNAIALDAPAPAWALAVPGAVEQVLDNLIDNAAEVAPPGTTIDVRVVNDGVTVALHVLDAGPGLGPDDRAQAFERFWRSAGAPGGGSGLGLAVVRQLAEASGGSARLDARTGRGLDAVVVLKATVAPRLPART
jgi:signal transduction histidine kinase